MDTHELVLKLTKEEFAWLQQEVNRRIKSIEHLLGGLSVEERKRAAKHAINECMGYRERLSEWRAIGSGQVVGAWKSMIGRRLKQTGAQWKVDRLNEMAVLCSVHYSDLWH